MSLAPANPAVSIPTGLRRRLSELFPGAVVLAAQPLAPDTGTGETEKGLGYGRPLLVTVRLPGGQERAVVFHQEQRNDYGHDRRADRAANILLAWDGARAIPAHVRPIDVGAVEAGGQLLPLSMAGEFYLLTEWAEGRVYAEDLREVGASGVVAALDLARVDALAETLVELHRMRGTHANAYLRAIRDLVGSGEGICGIVDGYGAHVPAAPPPRLEALERRCLEWRQRFKHRTDRLRRIHGDFHPFNIVFDATSTRPTLLDTSRGSQGDPADDVTCLSVNFLFFGLEQRERWSRVLGRLWHRFWSSYLAWSGPGVLEAAAPYFVWRVLVLCNPAWYPRLREADRDRLLCFAERVIAADTFDPAWGEEAMA